MSLITAQDISLSFGERTIFAPVSFRIAEGERIGLVGPNGSGKTTLLRVLAGEYELDRGTLQFANNCSIGYLPQDILELPANNVLGAVMESVPGRKELELRQAEIIHALETTSSREEQMRLSQSLANVQEKLTHFEVHFSEHEARKILQGLGFEPGDMNRRINEFSGGWKMRVSLASILFRKPSLILLDEPTNHLDVPSVIWFDDFLRHFSGAAVIVSHDRYFLNRQVHRIMSFEPEGLRLYLGNYDAYKQQREEEEEILEARAKNIDRERKELERFVERFRAKATKARQAQSRVKMIAKLEKNAPQPIKRRKKISFSFPEVARTGYEVCRVEEVAKSYGEMSVFSHITGTIYRHDRVAVIGRNGIGKTTLLKLIAGELSPNRGVIHLGHQVTLRYYAQHHSEILNVNNTILEEISLDAPTLTQTAIRSILGAFLFPGDDVEKPIAVLSGGEKARVALAKLLVKPGNFLLMDEPTNHLDVDASEALAAALKDFGGTILFVSHNRSFINHLATRIWDITPNGIIDYRGSLEEYIQYRDEMTAQDKPVTALISQKQKHEHEPSGSVTPKEGATIRHKKTTETAVDAKEKAKAAWMEEKARKREAQRSQRKRIARIKKLTNSLKKLEQAIEKNEIQLQEREKLLADPDLYQDTKRFNRIMDEYSTLKTKTEALYAKWERRTAELENLQRTSQ